MKFDLQDYLIESEKNAANVIDLIDDLIGCLINETKKVEQLSCPSKKTIKLLSSLGLNMYHDSGRCSQECADKNKRNEMDKGR